MADTVVVLGSGYAGAGAIKSLEAELGTDADITWVSDVDYHLVLHESHRCIRDPSIQEKVTIPIEDIKKPSTRFVQGHVENIDCDNRIIELADDSTLDFDYLLVAIGSRTAFFGIEGLRTHALTLKSLQDALDVHNAVRDAAAAATREDPARVVVGGAGLSGIQAAGELAELAHKEGAEVEVRLLEQEASVAPNFPERFQRAVAGELTDRGVTVGTRRTVERVDDGTIVLADGEELAYDQFVWTGGIAGQNALGSGRPQVRADLRLGERTFAVGDAARVVDADGQPAPASAQTAVRQADVAATNIQRLVESRDEAFSPRLERYRYDELGWLVSVGKGTVAQVGPTVVRGPAATALKTTVGAGYLGSVGAIRQASDYVWESVGVAD